MSARRRAFVIMPFGIKKLPDGNAVDCDEVYEQLLEPAITSAGLKAHRADADRRGGSIHLDMFQDLLLSEIVIADLTMDNPNVWYEIGVRHALRAGGTVLTYAARDRLPFDIAGQRTQRYTLTQGKLDLHRLDDERKALSDAIATTLGAWRGRRASPVYQQIPSLREPDWKSLKVGDVNEFWDALARWQSRIEIARRKQRPGDILVLAEETPNSLLQFEALRTAAESLVKMNQPHYALSILDKARELDPDDLRARQLEGMALGRAKRYAEAREVLGSLARDHKDGETQGIFARTWKDEWTQVWNAHPQRQMDPLAAARDTAAALQSAAMAYYDAFRCAPSDCFPGINALTLGRLWEHVTARKGKLPLDAISAGVRWATAVAVEEDRNYWSLVSRAELALTENLMDEAVDDYAEAAALAVANREHFLLDSTSQQLDFLGALGFHSDIVAAAVNIIDGAEKQLDGLLGGRPGHVEPQHVIVFSGHMIDDPARRGPGQAKPARFPPHKVDAIANAIRLKLDILGAGAGDVGFCGGACGGDLLFAEACLARGMTLEVRLAQTESEFLAESVTFADPDHRWERTFAAVKDHTATTVFVMPDELGNAPEGINVHDRCNRWILYSALSMGLRRTSFVTVWNGEPGDGPGGTQHMVEIVRKLTGRKPEVIDPEKTA